MLSIKTKSWHHCIYNNCYSWPYMYVWHSYTNIYSLCLCVKVTELHYWLINEFLNSKNWGVCTFTSNPYFCFPAWSHCMVLKATCKLIQLLWVDNYQFWDVAFTRNAAVRIWRALVIIKQPPYCHVAKNIWAHSSNISMLITQLAVYY